jgi:hypothetical protein
MSTRVLLAAVFSLGTSASLFAQTIVFMHDFESCPEGSNLAGQGGWVGYTDPTYTNDGPPVIPIKMGDWLSTKVVDGHSPAGEHQQHLAEHPYPTSPSLITTFTWDEYAPSGTHNQYVGLHPFGAHAPTSDSLSWSLNHGVWQFIQGGADPVYSLSTSVNATGFDHLVKLGIVLDGVHNELYGLFDFTGSGFLETPHVAITTSRIASMDAVNIYVDHRGNFDGIEADNFKVVVTPEPGAMACLGMLCGLNARRKTKR